MASPDKEPKKPSFMAAANKTGDGGTKPSFMDAIEKVQTESRANKKAKRLCTKVGKFLLVTVGLLAINCGYLVGGAYLFKYLEITNEQQNCREARSQYEEARSTSVGGAIDWTYKLAGMEEVGNDVLQEMAVSLKANLHDYAKTVHSTGYDWRTDCDTLGEDSGDWTLSNSLVYALTISTTIGYGAISPGTAQGRGITIIYAIIGIPLFLLFLANIGDTLASGFKTFYWAACCCGCCRKKKPEDEKIEDDESVHAMRVTKNRISSRKEDDNDEEDPKEGFDEDITVPLTVSMALLVACIILGGVIFQATEKVSQQWTYIDSIYFSFVTVSTLGFGDLVPDIDLKSSTGISKLITVMAFITIGMATISMCFQLMADEFVAKITWIGQKCGIKKKLQTIEESAEGDDGDAGISIKQASRPGSAMSRRVSLRGSFKGGRGRLLRRQSTTLKRQATNLSMQKANSHLASPSTKPKTRINVSRDGRGSVSPRTPRTPRVEPQVN